MSRLYRRGDTWYVDYVDERGHRVRQALTDVTSKRDAEGQLAELAAQARRRKLGLQPVAASSKMTVWQLVDWWLKERCPEASAKGERARLEKHVKGTAVASVPVVLVEATHFEALFADLLRADRPLSRASVNHVRAKLRTAFERARREGRFTGPNPLLDTQKLKTTRRVYETLTLEELPHVLAMMAPQWRGFVATAVFLALRKGEIGGLHKADVDLERRLVRVGRSWERQTVKGGETLELPLVEPLVPYFEAALKTPGPFMFPDAKGRMLPRESDPHLRLKTALKRAGIVEGYRVWCNRCPADEAQVVTVKPGERERCAVHERLLWVTPLPRRVRLHDMRHTTATILLRAGVPLHHVQRILRHASSDTTTSTYAHLVTPDLRKAMQGLQQVGTNSAQPVPPTDSPDGEPMQTTERSRRDSNARPLASEAGKPIMRLRTPLNARSANGGVSRASNGGVFAVPRADERIEQSVLAQARHNERPFRGGMSIDDVHDPHPASRTAGVRHG